MEYEVGTLIFCDGLGWITGKVENDGEIAYTVEWADDYSVENYYDHFWITRYVEALEMYRELANICTPTS